MHMKLKLTIVKSMLSDYWTARLVC